MINLIIRPNKFFADIRGKKVPLWPPIVILLLTGIFDGVVTTIVVGETSLTQLLNGGFPLTRFVFLLVSSNFNFYLLITLQTILFHIIIKKLGGTEGTRQQAFFILGIAALPNLIQSIIHLLFPQTIWWQNFEHVKLLYFLSYSFFNLFNIWSVALLIIGFAKVYDVTYKKSSILYLQFLLKLVPLGIIYLLAN